MGKSLLAIIRRKEEFLITKSQKDWGFPAIRDSKSLPVQAKLIKTGKPLVQMENDIEFEVQQFLYEYQSGKPTEDFRWVSRAELEKLAPNASTNLWILENY